LFERAKNSTALEHDQTEEQREICRARNKAAAVSFKHGLTGGTQLTKENKKNNSQV
jgi:hypothetical protein